VSFLGREEYKKQVKPKGKNTDRRLLGMSVLCFVMQNKSFLANDSRTYLKNASNTQWLRWKPP
jgi:hypothetical protein